MLHLNVRDKILDSTFVIRLNTGEFVIAACIVRPNGVLSLFFPYLLLNAEFKEFCVPTKNRRFDISTSNIQFVKAPISDMMDDYFSKVMREYEDEFMRFVEYFGLCVLNDDIEDDDDSDFSSNIPANSTFH